MAGISNAPISWLSCLFGLHVRERRGTSREGERGELYVREEGGTSREGERELLYVRERGGTLREGGGKFT